MSESLTADTHVDKNEPHIQAEIQAYLNRIEENREKMRHAQADIERLKKRTRAMLERLEAA